MDYFSTDSGRAISFPTLYYTIFTTSAIIGAYIAYQLFLSPLSAIPGPFWAKLSRVWITHLSWRGGTHTVMVELHKKHGKLVRIGPNEVSVAEPSAIKKIYGPGTKFRKSDWYSVFQGRRTFDLFPERDEKIHGAQRRLVSRPYSMESLQDLEPYVDAAVDQFIKCMDKIRDQSIDLGKWIQLFAFGRSYSAGGRRDI